MSKFINSIPIFAGLAIPTYYFCKEKSQLHPHKPQSKNILKKRSQHLEDIEKNPNYDIVVIGGGCNGAGVLLDASTRGFRTLLIEKNDFASGTSSKSTKLIHGGVRYLEQVFALSRDSLSNRWQKFMLVKEAIRQRGFMIKNAKYMNEKKSFVIPCENMFQSFYYYVGSVFYYSIYWFWCPSGTTHFNFPYFLNRSDLKDIFPYISDKYTGGVVYEDGCFNDSRMVLTSLLTTTLKKEDYSELPESHVPANILNKAEFLDFVKNKEGKIEGVTFLERQTNKKITVKAKYVVNCAGTWADQIRQKDNPDIQKRILIVGGSHITYNIKIGNPEFGLCLPSKDGRVLLVVPWLKRIIAGTTEKKFEDPETNPTITLEERQFISQTIGHTLQNLSPSELIDAQISRWTGLRPLVLNTTEGKPVNTKDVARTHVVEKSKSGLYSLMGGKWTTYRKMGEDLVEQIATEEKNNGRKIEKSVTQYLALLGSSEEWVKNRIIKSHGELGKHLYESYGSIAQEILKGDLTIVEGILTKAELEYIIKNEMVTEVQDILMRRTRTTFLHTREKTLSIIPLVAQMLLKEKKGKVDEKQKKTLIKESMEKILSYEFD